MSLRQTRLKLALQILGSYAHPGREVDPQSVDALRKWVPEDLRRETPDILACYVIRQELGAERAS